MYRRFLIPTLTTLLLAANAMAAAPESGTEFLERLATAVSDGRLSEEQALLYQFQYGFDQDALPADLRPTKFSPLKCATDIVGRYQELRTSFSSETVAAIDGYLAPDLSENKTVYTSPLGYFRLTYQTSGFNAVSAADANPANGIPDYVERCAEYMDTSWETEITNMGFAVAHPEPYPIAFENMAYYGYTAPTGGSSSRIVLHNTFNGFPPNDDPDGNALGAAKATCAHEFKHASQLVQSDWSEGGWVELDATWVEDVVFDEVNDFYNYLWSGNGISSPTQSLDSGGTGSYEDAIWQTWMSETWGNQIIVDLWNWRSSHRSQNMLLSYDEILGQYGSSIALGYPQFAAWNFACGSRSIAGLGFSEAADFPNSSASTINTYPRVLSGSTARLAARNYYCSGLSGLTGTLSVDFNGQDGTDLALIAVIKRQDGTGLIEPIVLDANNDVMTSLSVPLEEMSWAGVVVVNSRYSGASASWNLTLDTVENLPEPTAQLNTVLVDTELEVPGITSIPVVLTNGGEAGSSLDFTISVTDVEPTKTSSEVPWLTVTPASGSVPGGSVTDLTLAIDGTGLAMGSYTAYVVVESNDPAGPQVITVNLDLTDAAAATGDSPPAFLVAGNYPNPFNPSTHVMFSLAAAGIATIDVLDVQGRVVRTLHQGHLPAGPSSLVWDGRDKAGRPAASGTYLARLRSGEATATHKMVLAK